MWRSFFYAVGIGLFALGLQTLVVDHVNVAKDTRLQKVIRKVLSDDKPGAALAGGVSQAVTRQAGPGQATAFRPFQGYQSGSRFGPSRFKGPAYGAYGGARVLPSGRQVAAPRSNNSIGVYPSGGGVNAIPAAYTGPRVANRPVLQAVKVREWMPWSLLAAGAITFLYTHSLGRGRVE